MRDRARRYLQGLMFATLAVMSLQPEAREPSNPGCGPMSTSPNPARQGDEYDAGSDDCGNDDLDGDDGLDPQFCAALLHVKAQGREIDDALEADAESCEELPNHGVVNGAIAFPDDHANWSPVFWTSTLYKPTGVINAGRRSKGAAAMMGGLVNRFGKSAMGRVATRFPRLGGSAAGRVWATGLQRAQHAQRRAAMKKKILEGRAKKKLRGKRSRIGTMMQNCREKKASCTGLHNWAQRINDGAMKFRDIYRKPGAFKETIATRRNGKVHYYISKACKAKGKKAKCKGAAMKEAMKQVEAANLLTKGLKEYIALPAYNPYGGSDFALNIGDVVEGNVMTFDLPGTDVDVKLFINKVHP